MLHLRQGWSKREILLDGLGGGEEVLLFAEGVGTAEDDLFVEGLAEDFVMNFVFDGIGLGVDLWFERILGIRFAGLHDVGKELFYVKDVFTTFLMSILRIEIGKRLARTATFLKFGCSLTLSLELGFEQLLFATAIGDAIIVDGKAKAFSDVIFTRVGLTPCKDSFARFGALVHLEGLVLQLCAYPTTQIAIFDRFVLMEHAYHAAVAF